LKEVVDKRSYLKVTEERAINLSFLLT